MPNFDTAESVQQRLLQYSRICFEGKELDSRISFAKAEAVIEAYQRVRLTGQTHIDKKATGVKEKWHPPPSNVSKQGWE